MTDERLAEIRAATDGAMVSHLNVGSLRDGRGNVYVEDEFGTPVAVFPHRVGDSNLAYFLASARSAVPELLDALAEAQSEWNECHDMLNRLEERAGQALDAAFPDRPRPTTAHEDILGLPEEFDRVVKERDRLRELLGRILGSYDDGRDDFAVIWGTKTPADAGDLTLGELRAAMKEPEWETANERTVEWNEEQTAHLRERLASVKQSERTTHATPPRPSPASPPEDAPRPSGRPVET